MKTLNTPDATPGPGRQFLKTGQMAKRINVSPRTLHRWHAAGHFSARKVNPRVKLFDVSEVEAFLETARVGGKGGGQ